MMRFVDRNRVPVPPSLVAPVGATATERADAVAYYSANPPPTKAFGFEQYKSPDVVSALEALFEGKCAYCEGPIVALAPIDVEHFRPKGCVAGVAHPGYWWLALEWENLLPSCPDCNRNRKQFIVDIGEDGQVLVSTEKSASGKKDAFPIRGSVRACKPGDSLAAEDALLINPTLQDPAEHLRWVLETLALPIVVPCLTNGAKDPMAEASIGVYGLNRKGLVDQRGILLEDLATRFQLVRGLVKVAAALGPGVARDELLANIEAQMNALRSMGASNRSYSAAVLAYVETAEAELKQELESALKTVKP